MPKDANYLAVGIIDINVESNYLRTLKRGNVRLDYNTKKPTRNRSVTSVSNFVYFLNNQSN